MQKLTFWVLVLVFLTNCSLGQNNSPSKLVRDNYAFVPVKTNGTIEWDKFPEFRLPPQYDIVYQGPRFKDDTEQKPLKHGFSHLATFNMPYDQKIPFENRAGFSSGIAFNSGQPWGTECLSPWGNDIRLLKSKILEYTGWCAFFNDCEKYNYRMPVDLFVHDFEANAATDSWIKYLRSINCGPQYSHLSDFEYNTKYKKDHIKMHGDLMKYTKEQMVSPKTRISLYGESPIPHIYYDIAERPMETYLLNNEITNYLLRDTTLKFSENSPVMKYTDLVTPWCYYHHRYDEGGVKGKKGVWSYLYLPFLIFSIETQKSWTNKPVLPFVQMRLQPPEGGDTDYINQNIDPEMAEATAIFSIMSGGKGVWIWDQINVPISQDPTNRRNFEPYEHFVAGLYRLSRHNHILDKPDALYAPTNSRDLSGNRRPVVRGLIKGNKILIAAQATDVEPDVLTRVPVEFKNWKDTINLYGREVYLGEAQWTCEAPEALLKPVAGSNSTVVEGQTLKLSSAGGLEYLWAGPLGFSSKQQNPSITNVTKAAEGVYTLVARVSNACTNSVTVGVRISDGKCTTLQTKVFLEGPYNNNTGRMSVKLYEKGLLPGQTPRGVFALPTDPGQPYRGAPWNYLGTETDTKYAEDVVDWVLLSLRATTDKSSQVFGGAGLLHSDGNVTFNNTCANLTEGQSYYVVLEHRNHMGIMSPTTVKVQNQKLEYDFTKADSYRVNNPPSFGQKQIGTRWAMYAMDIYKFTSSQNYDINPYDYQAWRGESGFFDRYMRGDLNLDGEVNSSDGAFYRNNNGIYSKVPK